MIIIQETGHLLDIVSAILGQQYAFPDSGKAHWNNAKEEQSLLSPVIVVARYSPTCSCMQTDSVKTLLGRYC